MRLLALIFIISGLFASVSYAYIINKSWATTSTIYYSVHSSFMTESKNAFSNANTAWNDVSGKPFSIYRSVIDNTATDFNQNYSNEVFKASVGTGYGLMSTCTYYNSDNKVIEFDIRVNTSYTWANNGSPSAFDVQNCATHEIGHALFSADLYESSDTEKTMYAYADLGEIKKRTLEPDDIAGFAASN